MSGRVRQRTSGRDTLAHAEARLQDYLRDLAELVAVDSGSHNAHGVNRVADWVQRRLHALGFSVERIPPPPGRRPRTGDVLVGRKRGTRTVADGGRRVLLAGHMDTVFDDGTAAARPFTLAGPLAHGPGVSDDKGGLLAGLTALEILSGQRMTDYAELVFLATPDEEIGSPSSRPVTEDVARGVHYALALECARENGDLVVARKGVAEYLVKVTGRAAHAGIEPERGANAALTAARLTVALQAMNRPARGITVNVGVIRAGRLPNIVCDEAELQVEVRAATTRHLTAMRAAIEEAAVDCRVPGTRVAVEERDPCPPMEDTPATRALFAEAATAAEGLGITLGAAATGGVGDANLIAGTGTPTLDGLGPVGGGDHTPGEWLDTTTVAPRIALLASLIAALGAR
ncbi:M20/M25/M40 family metallo-hydrolase [Streptomyces tirandamycinicus]|uniref:M20/M25/M40 family metallo-hydrolase n=1 Tax=Streptomyces tirandamycinicus TaxID=2174846 RepID=UPI0022703FED|nr:M20/M25/M40 family metallo-hydrolase [Streptomyces tirandamycinicus]MCY0985348.1 M20/M25/M40 family metallo-hydrolase [Streptomyces tirandamycinicus]